MTIVARIAAQIFNTPLLVQPETAITIASSLADRFGIDPLMDIDASRFVGRPAEARLGNGDVRDIYRVEDGVALINVFGELVNRGAWIGASSGLTSYEGLDAQLLTAAEDSRVRAVVLDMNSPGGQASGAMETAALVRRVAQSKPVVAFVNAQAASAAYAIASGAPRIVTTPSGMLGSIGVVWMHVDRSEQIAKSGVRPTLLHAGAYKVDGHPLAALPDDARARIQAQIDDVYALFVDTVAAHRPMTAAAVRQTEAGVLMGQRAVDVGLADAVGSLDDVFAFLNRDRTSGRLSLAGGYMSETNKGTAVPGANAETVTKAEHDAAVASAHSAGHTEGVKAGTKAERERIGAVLGHDNAKGRESLAQHFAFKTEMPAEAAIEALAAAAPAAAAAPQPKTHRLDALVPNPKVDADAPAGADAQVAGLNAAVDRIVASVRSH